MRNIIRIPLFLKLIQEREYQIVRDIFNFPEEDLGNFVSIFNNSREELKTYWLSNPDWRFSQLLINYGILPNMPGIWYYMEENEILEKLGIDPREYLLWGNNFDENMNRLPETIWKPIKDLTMGHIQAILEGGWVKEGSLYHKSFTKELEFRKN